MGKFALFFFKIDIAAKRRKKHKNKISGVVISMCYNEQESDHPISGFCLRGNDNKVTNIR